MLEERKKEIEKHRGTRPKRLRREEGSIAFPVYSALSLRQTTTLIRTQS